MGEHGMLETQEQRDSRPDKTREQEGLEATLRARQGQRPAENSGECGREPIGEREGPRRTLDAREGRKEGGADTDKRAQKSDRHQDLFESGLDQSRASDALTEAGAREGHGAGVERGDEERDPLKRTAADTGGYQRQEDGDIEAERQKSRPDYYRWEPERSTAPTTSGGTETRDDKGDRDEQGSTARRRLLGTLRARESRVHRERAGTVLEPTTRSEVDTFPEKPQESRAPRSSYRAAPAEGGERPPEQQQTGESIALAFMEMVKKAVRSRSELLGPFFSGGIQFARARGRDVSGLAQTLDGAAAAAGDALMTFGGKKVSSAWGFGMSPLDGAAQIVHAAASIISPEMAWYTESVAKAMPSETFKGIATGAIDAVDGLGAAALRGDTDQLAEQHSRNLRGEYGVAVKGYAIAFDAYMRMATDRDVVRAVRAGDWGRAAVAATESASLNELDDAAASGRLGMWAKLGTWLGDRVFDATVGLLRDKGE